MATTGKKRKVYEVCKGYIEEDGKEILNWDNLKLIAYDAVEAIKKAKVGKREFIVSAELIYELDD